MSTTTAQCRRCGMVREINTTRPPAALCGDCRYTLALTPELIERWAA